MKRRFDEIDVMRIIGFLMVLDQHILGAYAKRPDTAFSDSMVLHFLFLLGRPAVPMFMAITGFTLFYNYYGHINVKEFYKKRLVSIVAPYIFWSFATIVVFNKYHLLKSIIPVLATGSASYHLWYMAMSIRLYLWFPIILAGIAWVLKRKSPMWKTGFVLFAVLYWFLLKENNYITEGLTGFLFGASSVYGKKFIQYSPIFWSLYFVCGMAVCLKYEDFKVVVLKYSRIIVLSYIPLAIYMYYTQICYKLPEYMPRIGYEHLLYILFMLGTTLVVYIASVMVINKANYFKDLIRELGSLSYGAYLSHVMLLQFIAPAVRKIMPSGSNLLLGLIIFIVTATLTFALCHLIRLLPYSQYMIGVRTKPSTHVRAQTKSV